MSLVQVWIKTTEWAENWTKPANLSVGLDPHVPFIPHSPLLYVQHKKFVKSIWKLAEWKFLQFVHFMILSPSFFYITSYEMYQDILNPKEWGSSVIKMLKYCIPFQAFDL